MPTPQRPRRLWDVYRFSGFRPNPTVAGIFGDPHARILTLRPSAVTHKANIPTRADILAKYQKRRAR